MLAKIVAVSLIGIPASGKTSVARKMVEWSRSGELDASVAVISFDDYIKEYNEGDYKRLREELIVNIEDLLRILKSEESNVLQEVLGDHELAIQENCSSIRDCDTALIILDDNMYFRSMRQRVRAISRSFCCGHFQIFMKSSLEEAKKRNRQRKDQVPESVIDKMFAKLELPQNDRTIEVESDFSDDSLLLSIQDRMKNPESLEVQSETKEIQVQSLIHEADLITRKELSSKIKLLRSNEDISSICASLNQKRKQFLDDLRAQKLNPTDVESLRAAFHCYLDE